MDDLSCLRRSIELAIMAEGEGNLPVGSVITLAGEIVSEGHSRIYFPHYDLTRHAEMEAIRALPTPLWQDPAGLTIYTTLEPCLMCMGAILLFGFNRVVFGAVDSYGGAMKLEEYLPPFFEERIQGMEWVGPLMPEECDPLHLRLLELEGLRGNNQSTKPQIAN
jgi:tRNA(adenine34) deaminase